MRDTDLRDRLGRKDETIRRPLPAWSVDAGSSVNHHKLGRLLRCTYRPMPTADLLPREIRHADRRFVLVTVVDKRPLCASDQGVRLGTLSTAFE